MTLENTFEYNHDPDLVDALHAAISIIQTHAKRTERDIGEIIAGNISLITRACRPQLRVALEFIQQYDIYEDLRERYHRYINDERNFVNLMAHSLINHDIPRQRERVESIAERLGTPVQRPDYSHYDQLEL